MDFWSRLIGGSRVSSTKTPRTVNPTERLTAFKRTCHILEQLWRSNSSPEGDLSVLLHTRHCIERLNTVLSDESRGPAPHPCLSYASTSQIYVTVTKLALSAHDEDIVRTAAVFFNTLIDAELDGVVDNRLFARALVDLVRRAHVRAEDAETRLIELLFGVANNIRLQPTILPAWFAPRSADNDGLRTPIESQPAAGGKEFAGTTRRDDFPLFYLLLDYVHHEGRVGDFARTGLLYLIETASRSKILEKWLIESDLATLMATGLGALYSQLGSLSFENDGEEMPNIIALSDQGAHETAVQPRLGRAMSSFLSYLLFWQDTIDHCRSAEVKSTLLDHFQVLFLEQLLYPSLLESSDVEGGSTSAVLTYLYRILECIEQPDLVHRILHFLLASPTSGPESLAASHVNLNMSISRRKSLDVLAAFAQEAAKPSPSLFNLRDLVIMGLESSNRQTILATFRLLSIIFQRHHAFTQSLIRTLPGPPPKQRAVGVFNAELQQLLTLATSITDDPSLDESYDNYAKDATMGLEARLVSLAITEGEFDSENPEYPMELRKNDLVFMDVLNHLDTFFTNSVVVNLALTEVIIGLASSHRVSLDGWLFVEQSRYQFPTSDTETTPQTPDALTQIRQAWLEPTWSSTDVPPLLASLQKLVDRIRAWRQEISDFDVLVAARRALLRQDEKASQAPTDRSRQPSEAPSRGNHELPRARTGRFDFETESPRGRSAQAAERWETPMSPRRSAFGSPLRDDSLRPPQSSRGSSSSRAAAAEELRRRLAMPFDVDGAQPQAPRPEGAETDSSATNPKEAIFVLQRHHSATLGHVLTNVVILYEFLLELTAMVQIRGNLFEEVGFPMVSDE